MASGITGSITHCLQYRAAAVALARDVVSLGVDAEPNEALPDQRMLELIALEDIAIDPREGTFTARLLVEGPLVKRAPLTKLNGRWLADHGLLVTAIVVPA